MAPTNDVQQRRERLLAARADCLAQMTEEGRRAFFEQGAGLTPEPKRQQQAAEILVMCAEDDDRAQGSFLAQEIRNLVAEVHRLRKKAEQKRDIRTALRAVDTAVRVIQLYGRATGAIGDGRRAAKVTVNVVSTRDEGIQTAAALLLELATANEILQLIERLQQRVLELEPSPGPEAGIDKTADSGSVAPRQPLECSSEVVPVRDSGSINPGPGIGR